MTVHLKISGDPITWTASDDGALAKAEAAVNNGTTIVLDVVEPLAGRLVLCGRNVSAVTALTVFPTGGWVPSHYFFTTSVAPVGSAPGPRNPAYAFAYLLGDGASDKGPLGYPLGDDADLNVIEEQVLAALAGGKTTDIPVGIPSQPGSVVVNGTVLGGVVLVPADPAAGQPAAGGSSGSGATSAPSGSADGSGGASSGSDSGTGSGSGRPEPPTRGR
jgi:hypothetical protein